jgi:hypothetical protein
MNILLRMLENPPFASYVRERQPTLAELAQDMRTRPGLVRAFGADRYLTPSDIPVELEVDPLSQRARFVFLPVAEWSELIEGIPSGEPPDNDIGTSVAARRVADLVALLPEDGSPDTELMLYISESYRDRVCLKAVKAILPYSVAEQRPAVEEVSEPCSPCRRPVGEKRVADCNNHGCPRGCKIHRWTQDGMPQFKCFCPPDDLQSRTTLRVHAGIASDVPADIASERLKAPG